MKIIGIDQANCKKCKECIKDCPSRLFFEVETTVNEENILEINFKDPHNACIVCGHCIAVCPTGAILSEGMEELGGAFEFEEAKDPTKIIDYGNILKLLRSRRSIRRFQNKPIPADQVKLILEAMRYAPTASNAQSWNYTVV
jgi:formate hydrogenlyase subunit 6/NADH:ubiquinone oxidoreductase subunit I